MRRRGRGFRLQVCLPAYLSAYLPACLCCPLSSLSLLCQLAIDRSRTKLSYAMLCGAVRCDVMRCNAPSMKLDHRSIDPPTHPYCSSSSFFLPPFPSSPLLLLYFSFSFAPPYIHTIKFTVSHHRPQHPDLSSGSYILPTHSYHRIEIPVTLG